MPADYMWQSAGNMYECKDEDTCSKEHTELDKRNSDKIIHEKNESLKNQYFLLTSDGVGDRYQQLDDLDIDISDLKRDDEQYRDESVRYHRIDSRDFKERFYYNLSDNKWNIVISKTYFGEDEEDSADDEEVKDFVVLI